MRLVEFVKKPVPPLFHRLGMVDDQVAYKREYIRRRHIDYLSVNGHGERLPLLPRTAYNLRRTSSL